MLTLEDVMFWLGGIDRSRTLRRLAKDAVDAVLWQAPEMRRRLAQAYCRDAVQAANVGDLGLCQALRFLAGLLLASVRWERLAGAERVVLPEPVDGHGLALVVENEDGVPFFYDADGCEMINLTIPEKARIMADAAKVPVHTGPQRRGRRMKRASDRERTREGARWEEV